MTETEAIRKALFFMYDIDYQRFQSSLLPTIDKKTIIGVRTPELRRYAREVAGTLQATLFMRELPHFYYEENNLHGLFISLMQDWDSAVTAVETPD